MIGIIIAGGFGTRMRPLTHHRPKHLLPVANRPFLEYQVSLLRRHGIRRIVFATNYFADLIEAHFGDGSAFGVEMHYALEKEPLGTAGAIRNAADLVPGQPVLVLNGDILTDFDLAEVLAFHSDRRSKATIALRGVERPHAFGALATSSEGRVLSWNEPTEAEKRLVAEGKGVGSGTDYINAGIYVLEPETVERIPLGVPTSIERKTYPELIAESYPIYAIAPNGFWMDMGRPEQYLEATAAVLTGQVQTDVPFMQVAETAEIGADVQLCPNSSVGHRATIASGSRLEGCIILDGVRIGSSVNLSRTILDEDVQLEDDVTARGGAVVAKGSHIRKGTRL